MKTFEEFNFSQLKDYAKYLIDEYANATNSKYLDSKIYWELDQFYKEGKIKNLISKNDKLTLKKDILENYRKDIINFCKDFKISIYILTFQDFLDFKKSGIDINAFKYSKQFNI